jgi:hypothetical protein
MDTRNHNGRSRLVVRVLCALAVVALLPALAHAAPAALPPRPTPAPLPSPVVVSGGGPTGGAIELRIPLASGAWRGVYWQGLWTVVQWQDSFGVWHDVDGWKGTPDEVASDQARKVWWVAQPQMGQGPFRWVAYDRPGGKMLAASESFSLPAISDQWLLVSLAP